MAKAKTIPVDRPGGLIESPGKYLYQCTGKTFQLMDGFRLEGDFALRQFEYESRDGKSCPNCTPAALVNALGFYRRDYPEIPADPHACYRILRPHLRLFRSPVPGCGGYPAVLNAVLVRRLWRLLGVDAWPSVHPFPGRKLMQDSREPLVLSLWSKAYKGHTVLLLGWEEWGDGENRRLFWAVRDGWRHEPRYLDAGVKQIWQAVRMANPNLFSGE